MKWDKEAKELLGRVPLFVRWKVKRRVEEEARRVGAKAPGNEDGGEGGAPQQGGDNPSRGGLDIGDFALNNPRRIPKKRRRDGT